MAGIRMNLWSLTLQPGEKYPLYVRRDFVLTNAALGEEAVDGRSVVKVTHNPINPAVFDDDSDDEDFDFDEEDLEDDDEEDEDEDEKVEIDGVDGEEDDDEEDDEEDDDEDDDEDDEDDDIEETVVLCSLSTGKIEQALLDLTFVEGEVVIFEVTGPSPVHLLGNYINQFPEEDSEDDEDDYDFYDEDDFDEDEFDLEDDEDEEEEESKIIEVEEKPKAIKATVVEPKKVVKRKVEEVDESPAKPVESELSKSQKKKLAKKARTSEGSTAAAPAATPAVEKKEKKRTLPSGLVIEDIKVGEGPAAKPGKRLGMRYIGKLENGKQFDANTSGKPFSFVLGRGEVIAGWDQGLAGMAVGGERRLTIPAQLAYGRQKIPGIPPNSTLKFEVKLVSIN